jgi:small-conductance mechanosensitive channel
MIRLLLVFCALIVGVPTAGAQQSGAQQSGAPQAGGPVSTPPAITADQAHMALDVLNDPSKRAAFAATLSAILNGQPGTAGTPAAPVAPPANHTTVEGVTIPLAPDSLGAQVLLSASDFVNHVGNQAVDTMEAVQSLPLLYGWLFVMATNPIARGVLVDVSWRVVLVLACTTLVEIGLRRAIRRPIHRLESLAPSVRHAEDEAPQPPVEADEDSAAGGIGMPTPQPPSPAAWILLGRVPLVFARLLLELIPVLGVGLTGHFLAGTGLGGQTISRLIILAIVDGYVLCIAALCLARMLLSPEEAPLRLFHLHDSTAAYLMRWIRRLIVIAVFGYAIGEVGLLLGLSDLAHDAMLKGVGLVLHLCLIYIVIRSRRPVRNWLRPPHGETGFVAIVRDRFSWVWHWMALFLLVSGWLAWAIEIPHGYATVLHYFFITTLILIGARLTLLLLLGVTDRVMRPTPDATDVYPGISARLHVYHPAITATLRLTIYTLCTLGLLQLYGLNTFIWLISSALGQRIISASATLLITVVLAFGAWETINAGVQRHLERLQRDAQLARSARLRTLLPLLRTSLLITIAIVAGLSILSEIGINIAPLLAGAGIVGVAIGFGSQKLVQDFITGIFLLLENAMQVGDTVTVSGLSGEVEALSVRTIRLRAADGSVHIIPFSSVTSVTNLNRGLGNAAVSVSVAYDEDTDRVAAELKAIVTDMRGDAEMSAKMLSDFQLWGVDKVDGASVTITGQVVCTDSGRWAVQREFNRRMKRRFQELGIRIFNPVQTITLSAAVQTPAERGDDHGHAQAAN